MATAQELFEGRTEIVGERPRASVRWVVRQATDEADAKTVLLSIVPTVLSGLTRLTITLDERVNADTWTATAEYGIPDRTQQEAPEPVFAFDTGGGSQHITQAIATVQRYGPKASSELGGAIGFDGENVAGVDITVPVYQFSETHYLAPSVVTQAYKLTLMNLTGTVNNTAFRGFAAGEVLFLGASGTRRGTNPDDKWEIAYKFAASPNRTGLSVGSITGIQKRGWDYLWVQYGEDVDGAAKVLIKKPVAVYIEQVYQFANFGGLGIGS
jgi:hypothetical protein